MTLSDKIRSMRHIQRNADVAKVLGCSPVAVSAIRWFDRNRDHALHQRRQNYHRTKALQVGEIPWNNDEIKFLRRNWSKMSGAQIAAQLARSRNSVIGKARRMGLKK